jgi:adenosylhomocysteine nucleosidase
LPPAALVALNPDGRIGLMPMVRSLITRPDQIPRLLALARDASRARQALIQMAKRTGSA